MSRSVGIDFVSPEDVRAAIDAHGDRYLTRVFTPAERTACTRATRLDPGRLATRVAAKEATFKAIGVGDRAMAWTDVEVVQPDGRSRPELMVSGAAATLIMKEGIFSLSLSFALTDRVAAAVVIAVKKS